MNKYQEPDEQEKQINSWDYELPYKQTYSKLLIEIISFRKKISSGNITTKNLKQFSYLIVGLTQLLNGCRISEAVEAFRNFSERPGLRNTEVKVLKRRDKKNPYFRKIVLPNQITRSDLEFISQYIQEKLNKFQGETIKNTHGSGEREKGKLFFVQEITKYFQKTFNFSSHALRYSFISYMAVVKKITVPVLAKITGHKNINLLLHYTDKKLASLELFKLADDLGFT